MIILYSTGCPLCKVLKKKLDKKGIEYIEITDKDVMISMGFERVPMLDTGKEILEFESASEWVQKYIPEVSE